MHSDEVAITTSINKQDSVKYLAACYGLSIPTKFTPCSGTICTNSAGTSGKCLGGSCIGIPTCACSTHHQGTVQCTYVEACRLDGGGCHSPGTAECTPSASILGNPYGSQPELNCPGGDVCNSNEECASGVCSGGSSCSYGTCTAAGCKSDADCTDPTKPVCDTATNICKIACHYENLVGSGDYMETCVSPSGTLADVCSGSTRKMAVCDWAANSCYYSDFSACSGSTPVCAVDGDGRAKCVECNSNDITYNDANSNNDRSSQCTDVSKPRCDLTTFMCKVPEACNTNADCIPGECCGRDPTLPLSFRTESGQCLAVGSKRTPGQPSYLCA